MALAEQYASYGEQLASYVTDTVYALHDIRASGQSLLFEGANACLLDIDHGTFPYVTSSNCSTLGIPPGTGLSAPCAALRRAPSTRQDVANNRSALATA